MSVDSSNTSLFHGFSKLKRQERFARLLEFGALTADDVQYLEAGGLANPVLAETLIENVIGYFQLPLGVATNFIIDQQEYVIPMAVEETSIVAALSKTAKWIRQYGSITTSIQGNCIIGQIQLPHVHDYPALAQLIDQNKQSLIDKANHDIALSMTKRGGGVIDLYTRSLVRPDGGTMAIIHLTMNCCDAMGANILNQILEYLKPPIESITNENVGLCILSNLNDQRLTTARVELLNIDPILGDRIQEASLFAELDPYRAATHNKGVMNGIDGVLIATGNDWRAVEAGMHAYAARNEQYQAISIWRYNKTTATLTGCLTAPLIVGTVGGVTQLHPTANLCLRMMKIQSAAQLSRVIAAVGLVQNLGAIRALCTDGIIHGHMRLHLDNLLSVAGATATERPILKQKLSEWLDMHKQVSLNNAHKLLANIRNNDAT